MNRHTPIRHKATGRTGRILSGVPRTSRSQRRLFVVRLDGLRDVAHVTEREIERVEAREEAMNVSRYVRRGLVIYAALMLAVALLEDLAYLVADLASEVIEGRET